jgi:sec-independent protein translocase protein TatC
MAAPRGLLGLNDPDPKEMTIVEHLGELRRRIIVCIGVIAVGSIAGWFFISPIFHLLVNPLLPYSASVTHPDGIQIILGKLTDAFAIKLKIALASGIALSLPVLLYQTWMFVVPAIAVRARRYAIPFVLIGIVLFACGAIAGYLVFPLVVRFLVGQGHNLDNTRFLLQLGDYVGQFALMLLVFGVVFEMPVVLTFLARIGVVSSRFLRAKRRHAAIFALVAAMIVTPGADPLTPFITAAMIYLLFEFSIIMVRLIHR